MKRFSAFGLLSIFALLVAAAPSARAENSSLLKVDLDVDSMKLIRADIDQLGWYYFIDQTACICWVGAKSAIDAGPATFECSRLKAHKQLGEYVKNCSGEPNEPPAAAPAPTPATAAEKK